MHDHGHIRPETRHHTPSLTKRWGREVYRSHEDKFCVRLFQNQRRKLMPFTVLYGLEYWTSLTYTEACMKLGTAMLHRLSCDGLIIPEDDE